MKLFQFSITFFLLTMLFSSCESASENASTSPTENDLKWPEDYSKTETYIEMRDGIKLFTVIYSPIDTSRQYPVMMKRTPYSCRPYGVDTMPSRISHNADLIKAGYIFVKQDVRGRWMSEGDFENTKPPYSLFDSTKTDELTDSWDTFQWLLDSLKNYNGNAGISGTSYPGWTTLVSARSNHPSIKAVLAMAPVTDFYFEDFNRYGLFTLNYLPVVPSFGTPRPEPTDTSWVINKDDVYGINKEIGIGPDYYDFFLDRLTLNNYGDILDSSNFFWEKIKAHPNYDEFRKKRNWAQYYDDITCNVMVAGGWNDEQNLYGILESYKSIAKNNPNSNVQFVMGPWSHGHPVRGDSAYYLGDVFYGYELSKNFMKDVEFAYFEKHLKGIGEAPDFTVKLFDTGKNEWTYFDSYPDNTGKSITMGLSGDSLIMNSPDKISGNRSFVSDPFHPVPFIEGDDFHKMAPKSYFTADQRFVTKRPDVLTFKSEILTEDLTVLGEIKAMIDFATDHNAADIYVKIIDVYPMDREPLDTDPEGVKMNGYQQLVRCGYIRGRYRNGFEKGVPFTKNQLSRVEVPLLDVFHTFKEGHQIMIQVQSSMFPLFDLNPQNYIEDIYNADRSDFTPAVHTVYGSSIITLPIY